MTNVNTSCSETENDSNTSNGTNNDWANIADATNGTSSRKSRRDGEALCVPVLRHVLRSSELEKGPRPDPFAGAHRREHIHGLGGAREGRGRPCSDHSRIPAH